MRSLLFAALVACGAKAPPAQTASPPATADDPSCPLVVPGTSLSVEDTAGGAALVFVTTGDATAVRTRAKALADMHTRHEGPAGALGMMFSASSTAKASDIDHGARVEFTAKKPEDAAAVQSELHMHGGHLTGGSCAM